MLEDYDITTTNRISIDWDSNKIFYLTHSGAGTSGQGRQGQRRRGQAEQGQRKRGRGEHRGSGSGI